MLENRYKHLAKVVATSSAKLASDETISSASYVTLISTTIVVPKAASKILILASFCGYGMNDANNRGVCWRLRLNGVLRDGCFVRADQTRNYERSGGLFDLVDVTQESNLVELVWHRFPTNNGSTICQPVGFPDYGHASLDCLALQ